MAWNPSPAVQVARDAAAQLGDADQCIVVVLNYATNTIQTVTYGRTRRLCDDARTLGVAAEAAVVDAIKAGAT
jgi:hypothetical protein